MSDKSDNKSEEKQKVVNVIKESFMFKGTEFAEKLEA